MVAHISPEKLKLSQLPPRLPHQRQKLGVSMMYTDEKWEKYFLILHKFNDITNNFNERETQKTNAKKVLFITFKNLELHELWNA